jgi:hypothetical protein
MYQKSSVDGFEVIIWSATCHTRAGKGICGFVTGLAQVVAPDGRKWMMTGSGCKSRRGVREVQEWVEDIINKVSQ